MRETTALHAPEATQTIFMREEKPIQRTTNCLLMVYVASEQIAESVIDLELL